MIQRDKYLSVWRELSDDKALTLLTGPRQCGKTTLAKSIADSFANSLYFNWDIPENKRRLIQNPYFFESVLRKDDTPPLIVLDELHKYRHWKNYLKGTYDQFHETYRFLVTGSGRLDIFKRGADSLAGRYRMFHMWPLAMAELSHNTVTFEQFHKNPLHVTVNNIETLHSSWQALEQFSGFPEPFVAATTRAYTRWALTYHQQLIHEDVHSLTDIRTVDDLDILFSLLPSKVGAPLSIPSLAQDLKVTYPTMRNWLNAFERFYLTFTLRPFADRIARGLHKEKKLYLFDYAQIEDPAARFENMVALDLLRAVTMWTDLGYGDFGLFFIRTREKREVDFVITKGRKPILLIEAKSADHDVSPTLKHFQTQLKIPAVQLVRDGSGHRILDNQGQALLVAPAFQWLAGLP